MIAVDGDMVKMVMGLLLPCTSCKLVFYPQTRFLYLDLQILFVDFFSYMVIIISENSVVGFWFQMVIICEQDGSSCLIRSLHSVDIYYYPKSYLQVA